MHGVGFEPTKLSLAELKSAPLDHSGIRASIMCCQHFNLKMIWNCCLLAKKLPARIELALEDSKSSVITATLREL